MDNGRVTRRQKEALVDDHSFMNRLKRSYGIHENSISNIIVTATWIAEIIHSSWAGVIQRLYLFNEAKAKGHFNGRRDGSGDKIEILLSMSPPKLELVSDFPQISQ
ncbi:unnamed protein product [Clonostachys rosea]|uniref:Uncharacterized protein n=1 Tax=Bionectria ochroleuca TaxID=29856 RepID=A0ABY6TW26_BIOOC|nr:unnamed protein product [Clonostachys rosea]